VAKVKIETGKTMASPKALATQLLGGKSKASEEDIKALTQKIRDKNNLEKGQDLTSDMVLKVGKITTKKFGTLVDPSDTNKYSFFANPVAASPSNSGVIGSRPQPTPNVPLQEEQKEDKSIKSASPDIIILDPGDTSVDLMLKLTLEKIGAQELISLVRHDTVNGQNIVYQPVKNISEVAIAYNPQNIIAIPDTADTFFKNFAIKLDNHIPNYSPDTLYIDMIARDNNVIFDAVNKRIIIELVNLKRDYEVEIQMVSSGQLFNDTIYEEDIS
jgi:hypothetical protein